MSLEQLSDESVERYYESIRKQAEADRAYKHQLTASPSVRERAEKLREEMIRRKLQHSLSTGRLSFDHHFEAVRRLVELGLRAKAK